MAETLSLRTLAAQIGEHLYPPVVNGETDYLALIKRFVGLSMKAGPGTPEWRRYAPVVACHLYALAESRKNDTSLKAVMGGLLFAGRLGRILACRLIRDKALGLEKIGPIVAPLPVRCRLFLLQELLRDPDLENRPLMQWAKDMLDPMAVADQQEILAFLEDLSLSGDEPCHLVRRTILRGAFPGWLMRTLEHTRGKSQRIRMCRAVSVLQGHDLTQRVAEALPARSSGPDPVELGLLLSGGASDLPAVNRLLHHCLTKYGPETGLTALDGMLRRSMPKTGQATLTLFKRHPGLRPALGRRLALMDGPARAGILKALPPKLSAAALLQGYAALAEAETGFARACLNDPPSLDESAKTKAKSFLVKRQRAALAGIQRLPMPKQPEIPTQTQRKGLLSRLVTDKAADLAEILADTPHPKDMDLTGASLADTAVTARNLSRLKLVGTVIRTVQFVKVTFSGVDFTSASLDQVDFTGCTFTDCTFATAVFRETTFQDCTFKKCLFPGTMLVKAIFTGSKLRLCVLADALFEDAAFDNTRLLHCPLAGCQFIQGSFRSSMFQACTVHGCLLDSLELHAVQWNDCGIEDTTFTACSADRLATHHTTARALAMRSTMPDEGVLARARVEGIHALMAGLADIPIPKSLAAPEVRPVLAKTVDRFGAHLQAAHSEACMLLNNGRRAEMSLRRMAGPDFFRLLPYLLHTDVFDQHMGLSGTTPCRIAGYTPDHTTLALAKQWFPDAKPHRTTDDDLVIEALFTMGSVGTVAQTKASDLDYWVCYGNQGVTENKVAALKRKLTALSQWADDQFGLEAVFFPMTLEDVRANRFGFSDKESSGSAQARMLKEEFYRTAILVAGAAPLWWTVPPGASPKVYEKTRSRLAADPLYPRRRFTDMGHASPVPPREFFGAALWQIVKAIQSPYKSVLKLGLLEKYASTPDELLLCDRIKRSVLAGRRDVESTDPYSALYLALRAHYNRSDDKDAIQLLTESLLLKSDVGTINMFFGFPAFPDEAGLLGFLFNRNDPTPPNLRKLSKGWSFAKTMLLGSTVNRFMTNSYKRIRAQRSPDGDMAITPEDMTRLGRQIAANFGRKKDKVMRVPFLGLAGSTYPALRFSAEKRAGKPTLWTAQGGAAEAGTIAVRDMEPLQKSQDLSSLLAWLVVNRVFAPNCLVDGERTIAPVAAVDLKKCLTELWEFMPPDEIFEVDPASYLEPEQITRAFFIFNLLAPRDTKHVAHVSVVCATTFGEVFCTTVAKPGPRLAKSAMAFLREITGLETPNALLMQPFHPKGSQCKRFSLL